MIINKIERDVLNAFIKDIMGDIGYYLITDDDKILFTIDFKKLNAKDEVCKLDLPDIKYIKERIKAFYPFFDEKKICDIVYVIRNAEFNQEIEINTPSDVILHNCKFNKGLVVNAKNVSITPEYYGNNNYNTNINCSDKFIINATELIIRKCNLNINYSDKVNINTKKAKFNGLNLFLLNNINLNVENLNIINSNFNASEIYISTSKIYSVNNKFKAFNLVSINNEQCSSIKNIYSPVIIYNGVDISKSKEEQLTSLRTTLIGQLNELKNMCNERIQEEVITYEEGLRKQSLAKRLKK